MKIRPAQRTAIPGTQAYYVPSAAVPGAFYTVLYIAPRSASGKRRRHGGGFFCTCPDFFHRRLATGRLCKHARAVKSAIQSTTRRAA